MRNAPAGDLTATRPVGRGDTQLQVFPELICEQDTLRTIGVHIYLSEALYTIYLIISSQTICSIPFFFFFFAYIGVGPIGRFSFVYFLAFSSVDTFDSCRAWIVEIA